MGHGDAPCSLDVQVVASHYHLKGPSVVSDVSVHSRSAHLSDIHVIDASGVPGVRGNPSNFCLPVVNGGGGARLGQCVTQVEDICTSGGTGAFSPECIKFFDLRSRVCGQDGYNFEGARIAIPTSYNTDFICENLVGHSDANLADFLRFGWPLGVCSRPAKGHKVRNHNSALQFAGQVTCWVDANVGNNSILGPFDINPFEVEAFFSPLGTVPKHDSDERRVIMDLSFPKGNAVNDLIPRCEYLGSPFFLKYPRVDDLVEIIKRKGVGCALWKRDLKKAYRQLVWIDPTDVPLLGFTWKGQYYFDKTGPMGSRTSAGACQRTAEGLAYIFENRNEGAEVVPYQDDIGSADTWDLVWERYNDWGTMLDLCGIQESPAKACPPSTAMVFLGILCDSERMTLEVPPDKISDILALLDTWLSKTHTTLKETQSLAGKLSWMSALVISGRLFLTRIFEFMRGMHSHIPVEVNDDIRKDIMWWRTFLSDFNGVSMMSIEEWSNPDEVFSTDGCLSGIGGWDPGSGAFFHKELPFHLFDHKLHISEIELLAICIALKIWGPRWARKKIRVNCDNEASVFCLNSGKCENEFMQECLREIAFQCARYHCQIRGHWIQGVTNRIADALSRWHLHTSHKKEFFKLVQGLNAQETYIYDGTFKFSKAW